MPRLTPQEQQEIFRFIEADKSLPEKYRFLLFEDKREIIREKNPDTGEIEEKWTGGFVFENEWQSFRTKKDRNLELTSVFYTYPDTTRKKIALKVVDIFGNDTMTIVEVNVGKAAS